MPTHEICYTSKESVEAGDVPFLLCSLMWMGFNDYVHIYDIIGRNTLKCQMKAFNVMTTNLVAARERRSSKMPGLYFYIYGTGYML